MRSWNHLHQVRSKPKGWKANYFLNKLMFCDFFRP